MKSVIRIAYVDSHIVVREGISKLLNSLGTCEVVLEAADGRELVRRLEAAPQRVDVCILDVVVPVSDGFDVLAEIRQRWPAVKLLLLADSCNEYVLANAIAAGVNGYLLKTCSSRELDRALTTIHRQGFYYSELITSRFFQAVVKGKIRLPEFCERDTQFLRLCCSDRSYVQIAAEMGVTPKSVDWTRDCLFRKLNVGSRSGLVLWAVRLGLVVV